MSVPSVSFEFFPPKSEVGEVALLDAASRLSSLRPEFVSVTYGAGGSTREPTARAVSELKIKLGLDVIIDYYTSLGMVFERAQPWWRTYPWLCCAYPWF